MKNLTLIASKAQHPAPVLTAAETTILAHFRRMAPVDAKFILALCQDIGSRTIGDASRGKTLRLVGGAR